jgi:ribosome biogenesis GTPase
MEERQRKKRTQLRKNRQGRVRRRDLTKGFLTDADVPEIQDSVLGERISGKGELTRKRNVDDSGLSGLTNSIESGSSTGELSSNSKLGTVVSVHGLWSRVLDSSGIAHDCTVRGVLKSLSSVQRNTVAAGDRVSFRATEIGRGVIDTIHPRRGCISRLSRGRKHVIAANIDYLLIVASCAEPDPKFGLVDRYILTALYCDIKPLICFNKVDLVEPKTLQQVVGVYAQLGFMTLFTSTKLGTNINYLRSLLTGRQTALAGQSGVGKSSLLNSIEPSLGLRVGSISPENEKGRHTTTSAIMIPWGGGGAVVDTPGIRQFQLWGISPVEMAGLMPDFRPYVSKCRYSNCLHLREEQCAVKDAVSDSRIDQRRYESYLFLVNELQEQC